MSEFAEQVKKDFWEFLIEQGKIEQFLKNQNKQAGYLKNKINDIIEQEWNNFLNQLKLFDNLTGPISGPACEKGKIKENSVINDIF